MNWFKLKSANKSATDLIDSLLYNEATFYNQFKQDLLNARKEVVIESPYITLQRMKFFKSTFARMSNKGVKIFIVTKHPSEHDKVMTEQAEAGINYFETLGPQVLLCDGGHHRKLAMIDRKILWEGSLNILSQYRSREFMRRIDSKQLSEEMFDFLNYKQILETT